jgi:hypothetical protein
VRDVRSRGVSCPFRLIIKRLVTQGDQWFLVHDRSIKPHPTDPSHPGYSQLNHQFYGDSLFLSVYPVYRKRTAAELTTITALTKVKVRPKAIVRALKEQSSDKPYFYVRRRDIYNERAKLKRKILHSMTPTQALVFILEQKAKEKDVDVASENEWIYRYETDKAGRVTHFFFTHRATRTMIRA